MLLKQCLPPCCRCRKRHGWRRRCRCRRSSRRVPVGLPPSLHLPPLLPPSAPPGRARHQGTRPDAGAGRLRCGWMCGVDGMDGSGSVREPKSAQLLHPGTATMAWLAANALPAATLPAAAAHPAASQLTAGTVRLARSLKRLRVCAAGAELCGCAAAACKAGASAELRHEDAARAETGRMPPRLPAPVAATACRAGSFSPSAFSPTAWLPQRRREETVMAAGAVLPAQRAELEAARRPSAACCNMMMVAAVAGG